MNKFELYFFVLNIVTIIIILTGMLDFWIFGITFLLLMLIVLVERLETKEKIKKMEKSDTLRRRQIEILIQRLADFSDKIDDIKIELKKNMFAVENRMFWEKRDYEKSLKEIYRSLVKKINDLENRIKGEMKQNDFRIEMDRNYRDLARKILDVENKLNNAKKTLATAIGSLDDRVTSLEKRE